MSPLVRRAKPEDAPLIHQAHMLSIQQICSKLHTPEEISGWGHRPFNSEQRLDAIEKQLVWVVELQGQIEGYSHLQIYSKNKKNFGHIHGLYLTPKVLGLGLGRKLCEQMLFESVAAGVTEIKLESTLSAHEFYQKMGFTDSDLQKTIEIGGSPVRYFPMALAL